MGGGQSHAAAHPVDTYSKNGETWREFLDEATNEPYWHNVDTGDTVFEAPGLVKLVKMERDRHAALYGEDLIDAADQQALDQADRAASIRRLATVEKLVKSVEEDDKKAKSSSTFEVLVQSKKDKDRAKGGAVDNSDIEEKFAEEQLNTLSKARLSVEAENEVQRFVDWLEMNRARVDYEDKYGSEMPLEMRFRSILVKSTADITEEEVKELRNTRQTKTEVWTYDEAKILMVQSAYRKRKGKFQVHMLRQAKVRRQQEHAQEIEKAEVLRRTRVLEKLKKEEALAKEELEHARHRENQEHIDSVLVELRNGTNLILVPHNPVQLSDGERRKLLRKNAHALDAHHGSLRGALRGGTFERQPRGHFEKLRLARMLMSENTLRRCFMRWETRVARWLELRRTMLASLRHLFDLWRESHVHIRALKRKVATAVHNFYAMYIGTAFERWWKRTRHNYHVRALTLQNGARVTYVERRDDFTVINSFTRGGEQRVKGKITRRYFVDLVGRQPDYDDAVRTRRRLKLKKLPEMLIGQEAAEANGKEAMLSPATTAAGAAGAAGAAAARSTLSRHNYAHGSFVDKHHHDTTQHKRGRTIVL
jgi:hypothetical protein